MTNYIPLDVRANLWGQTFNESLKLGRSVDEAKEFADGAVKAFIKTFRAEFKQLSQPRETVTMTPEAVAETLRRAEEAAANGAEFPTIGAPALDS